MFSVKKKQALNYVHISDKIVTPRAFAVMPSILQFRGDSITPQHPLNPMVRFGPIEGIKHLISNAEAKELADRAAASGTPIFLIKKDKEYVIHIDVSDIDKSNWMGLLRLGDQSTSNLWLYEEGEKLYGITTKVLTQRTSLLLGYSKMYTEEHQLPQGQPVLDLAADNLELPQQWRCHECRRTMKTMVLLQHHYELFHKETKPTPRRRRCLHCSRTFSNLFSLKRHVAAHCTKKVEKLPTSTQAEEACDLSQIDRTQQSDENQIPSDESFQNYTNNIDFPTNLFDTSCHNFDLTAMSTTDMDFSSYLSGNRFENDLGNPPAPAVENPSDDKEKVIKAQPVLTQCSHCDQSYIRGKHRHHNKVCPKQRSECKCGRVFHSKAQLTEHIYSEHPEDTTIRSDVKNDSEVTRYNCEQCDVSFKRRGMLANHQWRAHGRRLAAPLQRRDRHYPCAGAACRKLYRSAAKRDHHMRNHHPGLSVARGQCVVGGVRACAAAACPAPGCPRQYAARAKLMQHVRSRHPRLVTVVTTDGELSQLTVENENANLEC